MGTVGPLRTSDRHLLLRAGAVLCAAAVAFTPLLSGVLQPLSFLRVVAAALLGASAVLVLWRMDPVRTFSLALLLAPLSGNWSGLGIPGVVSPNRIVLVVGVLSVLMRGGESRDRPDIRVTPAHVAMIVASGYVLVSAVTAGTAFDVKAAAAMVERFGFLPFLVYFVAPAVFRTERDRERLLVAFIALGAYLGLTALFETLGLDALVFPRYINDPNFGILPDRARGPFVEPAQDAMAMFACACACAVYIGRRGRSLTVRFLVALIGMLCLTGVLFTLTRAAWLGAAAGIVAVSVLAPGIRRFALPGLVAGAAGVALAVAIVPGLSQKVTERRSDQGTVYDRLALNRAGLSMLEARPLVGFGWNRYYDFNRDYLRQGDDYDMPFSIANSPIHNLYLNLGVELGLVGLTLWLMAVGLAVGGAILRRGPPEIQAWRWTLVAVTVFYIAISNFEPTQTFSSLLLLLLAGVVRSGHPDALHRPMTTSRA